MVITALGIPLAVALAPQPYDVDSMPTRIAHGSKTDSADPGRWAERIEPHLRDAEARAQRSVDHSLALIEDDLTRRHERLPAFAEAVLSWRGKWAYLRTTLPANLGGDSTAYLHYLDAVFAREVIDADDLEAAVTDAVATCLDDLAAIENRLFVSLRADLDNTAADPGEAITSADRLGRPLNGLVGALRPVVAEDLGVGAAREVSSFVAGEIAVAVLAAAGARLGVSAGVLTAGGGSAWSTFGLSIVAAIGIDQAIGWALADVWDPRPEICRATGEVLDRLGDTIIEGTGTQTGLRDRLEHIVEQRLAACRAALIRWHELRRQPRPPCPSSPEHFTHPDTLKVVIR